MPTQLEKLEAHASHLLDAFIKLRQRYSILEPLLFDKTVVSTLGSGKRAVGFSILKDSLFLSCAQDIAKLTLDDDTRTPSLKNIIRALADDALRLTLREQFAAWEIPQEDDETESEILEALRRIELREEAQRGAQFDDLYCEAIGLWSVLSDSSTIKSFRTIRDKVTAHTEVHLVVDKYRLVDIGTLGIKWGDMKATLEQMQRLVEIIGMLIRNAGFAWESFDEQLKRASMGLWGVDDVGS
ncbi:AbiU2 domain-containing protein [Pseudomonas putida]|uniref:AbiU2 domain-containing protein n=1 Tax=Pseudomonas putida TaxID=303 RepID=UPI003FD4D6AE